jgi:phosphate transport system substrate-binding protein
VKKVKFLLVYFGLVPFGLSFLTVGIMFTGIDDIMLPSLIPLSIGGLIFGVLAAMKLKKQGGTEHLGIVFLFPLSYTAALWAIGMLISRGFYGNEIWTVFGFLHFPLIIEFFISMFSGEGRVLLGAPLAYEISFLFGLIFTLLKQHIRPVFQVKKIIVVLTVFFLGIGTGSAVQWNRSKTVLPSYGFEYGGGYSSTDLTPYEITNPNNKLPKLESPSTFRIKNRSDMPILDGAEAAFPVYSAFANATYENIKNVAPYGEIVTFSNTIYAYERLLSGEIDVYFGAEPSQQQKNMAEKQGKELRMTPIGKEAFVFFVNPKNKVNSLKVSEIRSIYSGKIKNWSEVGGEKDKILAFQRPKNSGSQTLLEKIMGDTPIMKPLEEDVPEGMGGIINKVADYRNYDNSIGFSFRFFATGMVANPDIKLLAINGIEPSPENISSETYPFTANLYAISLQDNPKSTILPFLEWMRGPQGQEIIEKIGYIGLKEK